MSRKTKNAPVYAILLATLFGFSLKYASPLFQIIFCGISIVILIYEILQLKKDGGENDKIGFFISIIIFVILIGLVVVIKNYISKSDNIQVGLLIIAFVEFILSLAVFGYRIVAKSGDFRRIRQFVISIIMLFVVLIILGLFILYSLHNK